MSVNCTLRPFRHVVEALAEDTVATYDDSGVLGEVGKDLPFSGCERYLAVIDPGPV